MRNVAIFDIDGTIFRSSLLIELVEVLIEEKIFPVSVRADYAREKVRWLDRKGDYDSYISAVVKVFVKNIKGVSYKDFNRSANIVVDRYRNRTYRMTTDLIAELKRKKYFILADFRSLILANKLIINGNIANKIIDLIHQPPAINIPNKRPPLIVGFSKSNQLL